MEGKEGNEGEGKGRKGKEGKEENFYVEVVVPVFKIVNKFRVTLRVMTQTPSTIARFIMFGSLDIHIATQID